MIYDSQNRFPGIYKLHGSVNWYGHADDLTVAAEIGHSVANDKVLSVHHGNISQPNDWWMVPPSVIKPQMVSVLEEQWRGAATAISQADALWFIGYSFPESDSFMRFFLASSLADNVGLTQIVVIDPDKAVKARCRTIFRSARLNERFVFLPFSWTDLALEKILASDYRTAITDIMLQTAGWRDIRDQILSAD